MKELSLNILDIAKNSVKAGATLAQILLEENEDTLKITVADNGCGMKKEMLESVIDPFCTTRTTRKVGMGIPLFKLAAEQTGGEFSIESKSIEEYPCDHGTVTAAVFYKNSIDYTPLGDAASSVMTLIQGSPDMDFLFVHTYKENEVRLDTRELREILGQDVSLASFEVICWIRDYLAEGYSILYN